MVAKTEEALGTVGVLVNNAGNAGAEPILNKSRFGKPIKIFGTAQSALIFTASLIVSVRCCPA